MPGHPDFLPEMLDVIIYDLVRDIQLKVFSPLPEFPDVTATQTILLRKLSGPVTASQIGEMMGITSGPVTTLTHGLVRKGYLRRDFDQRDRRVVWYSLSDSGLTLIRRIADRRQATLHAFLSALPDHTKDDFSRLYTDVHRALRTLDE
jgi:DNA-binding MarR family transcriptional regulator